MNEARPPKMKEFIDYVYEFYGPNGIYPMQATKEEIGAATVVRIMGEQPNEYGVPMNDIPFQGDSIDRECVRDVILMLRGM